MRSIEQLRRNCPQVRCRNPSQRYLYLTLQLPRRSLVCFSNPTAAFSKISWMTFYDALSLPSLCLYFSLSESEILAGFGSAADPYLVIWISLTDQQFFAVTAPSHHLDFHVDGGDLLRRFRRAFSDGTSILKGRGL